MTSLECSPPFVVPGQRMQIRFSGLSPDTTHVVVRPKFDPNAPQLRAAPEGSEIDRLIQSQGRQAIVFEGVASAAWNFDADVGGVYNFDVTEERRNPGKKSKWQGDPSGAPYTTRVTETKGLRVHVGTRISLQIGEGSDVCTLRLYVWDQTVRATTFEQHGVVTPALEPQSHNALFASQDPAFLDAVANLVGLDADTLLGDFDSDFQAVRLACSAHMGSTSFHTNSDVLRALGASFSANSLVSSESSVNALRDSLQSHMRSVTNLDDSVDPPYEPTHTQRDGSSCFLTSGASSDRASHLLALADIIVTLERHKLVSDAHLAPDPTVTVNGSPLLTVFCTYLRALRSETFIVPPEQSPGVARLVREGFQEAAK